MPSVKLTDKELTVVKLICKGYTNYEIANELGCHLGTVKNIISNIYNLFEIHSCRKLIYQVYKAGLVKPPEVEKW